MKDSTPAVAPVEGPVYHFMIAATVFFTRDGKTDQRTINAMTSQDTIQFNMNTLGQIQHAIIARVLKEEGVQPDAVKDIVFTNIMGLGRMTAQEFFPQDTLPAAANESEG